MVVAHAQRRQEVIHVMEVVGRDANLVQVVLATRTAGKSSATSTPIMAITTSNSTSVKPAGRTGRAALLRVRVKQRNANQ
jgi:hypothetical protein